MTEPQYRLELAKLQNALDCERARADRLERALLAPDKHKLIAFKLLHDISEEYKDVRTISATHINFIHELLEEYYK